VPDRGRVEVIATVLLAAAAVGTAWATYQAAHWRSEQAAAGNRSTAARVQANRAAALANRQVQVQVETFIQWVNAREGGNTELATFYRRRFRPEFRPAFAAWIATRPFTAAGAPATPFEMPQYHSAAVAQADRLEAKGAAESAVAAGFLDRADRYTLCVVLFAMTLFFAGLSARLRSPRAQTALVGIGCVVFLAAAIWVATFPVSVAL
jgi:hypothetical protein